MPRIALRVGATRQPCRLRLTDGTHTALHRLAPRPRHMRERPRQPTRTRCTVPRSHRHARALRASAVHRNRASCTRSNEYSKASMLQVQSAADARRCQLGCGWCVSARVVARPTLARCQTSSCGARRLACDARTPGRHSRALGHDARVRRLMNCMVAKTPHRQRHRCDHAICEHVGASAAGLDRYTRARILCVQYL